MIDLIWGESICVRQAFVDNVHANPTFFDNHTLMGDFGYPKHEGDPRLVSLTADVIKRQTSEVYKHIFLTNGATGAVVIAMRAFASLGFGTVKTSEPPYFSLYPGMIKAAAMNHITDRAGWGLDEFVELIDSPSNPRGNIALVTDVKNRPSTILDAVYHNRVYTNGTIGTVPHDIVCGSYSKLTGLNGIRVGWIATNDDLLALEIQSLVTSEYCGISFPSTHILLNTLDQFDWDQFELNARFRLDMNRDEWAKVTRYFARNVNPNGMFYYTELDTSAKKLLAKAGILYQCGSKMDHTGQHGRFNLGQSNELIREAVKAILKADRI